MSISKRNIRGLQDIRTLSGRIDQAATPYKAYMKLSCLEMEKYRRGKERDSAMNRVNNIDARFRDIDAEKVAILKEMDQRNIKHRDGTPDVERKPSARQSTGCFKIRY